MWLRLTDEDRAGIASTSVQMLADRPQIRTAIMESLAKAVGECKAEERFMDVIQTED